MVQILQAYTPFFLADYRRRRRQPHAPHAARARRALRRRGRRLATRRAPAARRRTAALAGVLRVPVVRVPLEQPRARVRVHLRRRAQHGLLVPPRPAAGRPHVQHLLRRRQRLLRHVARRALAHVQGSGKTFMCFLSHHKASCAMEARFIKEELERMVPGAQIFLDSDECARSRVQPSCVQGLLLRHARNERHPLLHQHCACALPAVCISIAR